MLALILRGVSWLLGWWLGTNDERDKERQAGEQLGAAKSAQAAAEGQLQDVKKAQAARDSVGSSPADVMLDKHNLGP